MAQDMALWDDSALVNAFNSAMIKYKDMHRKPSNNGVAHGEFGFHEEEPNKDSSDRTVEERNKETARATIRGLNADLADSEETGQAEHLQDCSAGHPPVSENTGGDHTWPSGQMNYADEQHTRLVNSYYELEKQKQEVLQQLYQLNSSNYVASNEQVASNSQCSCGSFQRGQDGAYNPCYPPMQPYCHSYPHYWPAQPVLCMGLCSQGATCCSLGAGFTTNKQPNCHCQYENYSHFTSVRNTVEPSNTSLVGEELADTIFEAVKKATSTVKTDMPKSADICKGELKFENSEGSSSADITEMLHAWFSAGFATARYLHGKANGEEKHEHL